MPGDKLRFRFSKTGTLRLTSHHDLMRCVERMLRRAALPFRSTAGFHPSPRIVFALSLPLGIEGLNEVVEIEFLTVVDEHETLEALRRQSPAGLEFRQVSVVPMRATARPRRAVYGLVLPPDRRAATAARCTELLAAPEVWVNRLKPSPKALNIRPYLRGLAVADDRLTLDLWVTQGGTARPQELLRLLDLTDLTAAGSILQRLTIELHDETSVTDPNDVPPGGAAHSRPLDPAAVSTGDEPDEDPTADDRGPVPVGPVVE